MCVLTRRRRSNSSSSVLRRRRSVLRRLHLSVCRGKLGGATWLLLCLRPHGKRIGF
jgi:hypothetical protein